LPRDDAAPGQLHHAMQRGRPQGPLSPSPRLELHLKGERLHRARAVELVEHPRHLVGLEVFDAAVALPRLAVHVIGPTMTLPNGTPKSR
jgi:hypothetical protein